MASRSLFTGLRDIFSPQPTQERPPAPTGAGGRDLPAAVITAIALVVLVVLGLAFAPTIVVVLVAALALSATWEIAGALARVGIRIAVPPLYVGALGMLTCAWTLGAEALMAALLMTFFAVLAWVLLGDRDRPRGVEATASVFVAVYVSFLASFVPLMLRDAPTPWVLIVHVIVTATNDTGGWLAGSLFGRHPMAPRLSPKKSWEGFAGSILTCIGMAIPAFMLLGAQWWWGLIAGVLTAVVGTLGDLTESLIKREVGLKDMSNLLPGHGGILDRVDAQLLTAPLFYFLFILALGGPQ